MPEADACQSDIYLLFNVTNYSNCNIQFLVVGKSIIVQTVFVWVFVLLGKWFICAELSCALIDGNTNVDGQPIFIHIYIYINATQPHMIDWLFTIAGPQLEWAASSRPLRLHLHHNCAHTARCVDHHSTISSATSSISIRRKSAAQVHPSSHVINQ